MVQRQIRRPDRLVAAEQRGGAAKETSRQRPVRVGLVFPSGLQPRDAVRIAKRAEVAGLSSVWATEGYGGDAFALLSASALDTSSIGLGTAVVSVYVRSLPLLAMSAATVDDLSGGRFHLGIGVSHREQVEGEHAISFASPFRQVEMAIETVRRVLRRVGEPASYALGFVPQRQTVPIYVAAGGPKMERLGWQLSDGLVVIWRTPEEIRRIAGNRIRGKRLLAVVHCAIGRTLEEGEAALNAVHRRYSRFERYRRLFDQQNTVPGIVCSNERELSHGLDRYSDVGVDDVLLLPISASGLSPEETALSIIELVGLVL